MLNGGLRREILAGLRLDRLIWTDKAETLMAIVEAEKVARSKTNRVPLCIYLKPFIEFFISYVRPALLIATPDVKQNDTILGLWISYFGHAMEYDNYSKSIITVSQEFHPTLRLTSLSFRRAFITAFFKGQISYQGSFDDFMRRLSVFLNVSPQVMETHYNRYSALSDNVTVQQAMCNSINFAESSDESRAQHSISQVGKELEESIKKNNDKSPLTNNKDDRSTIPQRLKRTTLNDNEWKQQLKDAGFGHLVAAGKKRRSYVPSSRQQVLTTFNRRKFPFTHLFVLFQFDFISISTNCLAIYRGSSWPIRYYNGNDNDNSNGDANNDGDNDIKITS